MPPHFSLLHASFGRSEKAIAAMKDALAKAALPEAVEYVWALEMDDPDADEILNALTEGIHGRAVLSTFGGSAPAWNGAAKMCTGEILIQMQDDVELPQGWDLSLLEKFMAIEEHEPIPKRTPAFVAVSDGFRKDSLCCTAIMNRPYFEREGYFLYPGYKSVFSDDDVTYRAYRHAKAGTAQLIEARDIVFLHRHHYHDKSVPMDATYQRENSGEAYAKGHQLFVERNPDAATDGIVNWR